MAKNTVSDISNLKISQLIPYSIQNDFQPFKSNDNTYLSPQKIEATSFQTMCKLVAII